MLILGEKKKNSKIPAEKGCSDLSTGQTDQEELKLNKVLYEQNKTKRNTTE